MAENTIDNLSIQVTASAENAARVFDRLASSAGRLRGAVSGAAGGMQDMAQGARDAGAATQAAGEQAGRARINFGRFWNALRNVGTHVGGFFVNSVQRGVAALGTFVRSLGRIAFYRAIRSILKDLGQSFKDLYGYSKIYGVEFAKSMDRITTATTYMRNSFAAMVAPLVNLFAPALDMLADKIVDILNFVNQLFAAINGQETYTVAKKVATTWESTFDSSAKHAKKKIKEVKNTLLGFDEINRLNGKTPTTSGRTGSSPYTPGYSTMFEEKPLEGFFKKISDFTSGWPDWLKWLLGIGGGIGLAWGLKQLPKLLGGIWDWLKKLFSINIPDWFRWLFGPKGNGNGNGIDLPDNIKLPDADVKVNLDTDDIEEVKVPVSTTKTGDELFKDFRSEWNTAKTTLFVNDKLLDSADELFKEFRGEWNKVKTTLFVNDKLLDSADELFKEFRHEWNTIKTTLFVSNQLLKTGEDLFSAFHREWESAKSTLYASVDLVKKWSGSAIYALGLDNINATASIDAYAQWWHMGIMRYLGLDDIDATAWVDVMTPWWYYGKSVLEWLGLNNLSTTVTVHTQTVSSGFYGATNGGGKTSGGGIRRGRRAKGGIFANGLWSSIPQYAGGTAGVNHGSLFWAGENGAEIVGNAGGRTEVLNKSQIASAMYSAVQAAMAPAAANFAEAAANMGVAETGFDFETLADMVRQGVEQAMSRSNDYDRQKVELLRSINDKDFNVDVSTASINKAQSRMNRRAGVTIAPVGT